MKKTIQLKINSLTFSKAAPVQKELIMLSKPKLDKLQIFFF